METDPDDKKEDALTFLVNHDAGVLATVSANGQPSARMVYYTSDDDFNVYFITLRDTRKFQHLHSNERAAFVVSETEVPRTIQIEGRVDDLSDTATNDALLTGFLERLMSHKKFGIPLAHFDSSELVFYKLTPTWIRWGDFTFGQGTKAVLTELKTPD